MFFVVVVFFLFRSHPAISQPVSTDGTDFIVYPGELLIGSYTENRVVIFAFDSLGHEVSVDTTYIHPNMTAEVTPYYPPYGYRYYYGNMNKPGYGLFHVVSKDPISV